MIRVKVKLEDYGIMPKKAHKTDAGFDIFSPRNFKLYPGNSIVIDTGVRMAIPEGYCGFVKSKSGLYMNANITAEGVVDSGYTGTIRVKLCMDNESDFPKTFLKGDKITQLVILQVPEAELIESDELEETERGDGGFGSTGR